MKNKIKEIILYPVVFFGVAIGAILIYYSSNKK